MKKPNTSGLIHGQIVTITASLEWKEMGVSIFNDFFTEHGGSMEKELHLGPLGMKTIVFIQIHSSPKETQVFESCISFGEDCMPLDLGSYIISI